MFLILTVIGIKCLFVTKMKRKPKIRNTVGFRILSILYGLGLFLSVFLNTVIPNQGNEFIFHYIISLVFNSIILITFFKNEEALEFYKAKVETWREEKEVNKDRKKVLKKWSNRKTQRIFPSVDFVGDSNSVQVLHKSITNEVLVIDLETFNQ